MELPQSTIDRIHKEAEKKYPFLLEKGASQMIHLMNVESVRESYIAGAESEANRAQELVEELEQIRISANLLEGVFAGHKDAHYVTYIKEYIEKALEKYKL